MRKNVSLAGGSGLSRPSSHLQSAISVCHHCWPPLLMRIVQCLHVNRPTLHDLQWISRVCPVARLANVAIVSTVKPSQPSQQFQMLPLRRLTHSLLSLQSSLNCKLRHPQPSWMVASWEQAAATSQWAVTVCLPPPPHPRYRWKQKRFCQFSTSQLSVSLSTWGNKTMKCQPWI